VRLREAIARKVAGEELVSPAPEPAGNVISLMDALQASLDKQKFGSKAPTRRRKAAGK